MADRASGWVKLRIKQMGSPIWPSIPAQTGTELESFVFNILDYEASGQATLFYDFADDPPDWIRMSFPVIDGVVPDTDADQTYEIPLLVRNDLGSDTVTLVVNVEDTVNVPVWSAIPNQRVAHNESIDIDLDRYLTGSKTLTVMASGLPGGMSFDADERQITGKGTALGTREVMVSASNHLGSASASFEIEVRDIAPQWSTIPDQTVLYSDEINLDLNDYISSDVFEVTIGGRGLPTEITIDDGVLSGMIRDVGTHEIRVSASNTAGSAATTFDIEVESDGTAPVWSTVDIGTWRTGSPYAIDLHNFVTGPGPITITHEAGTFEAGLLFAYGLIYGTPVNGRDHSLTFRATNAEGSADTTFTLTIDAVGPPTVSIGLDEITVESGADFTAEMSISHADRATISGPSGWTLDSSDDLFDGNISGSVPAGTPDGDYTVTVTAYDDHNRSASDSITIKILAHIKI